MDDSGERQPADAEAVTASPAAPALISTPGSGTHTPLATYRASSPAVLAKIDSEGNDGGAKVSGGTVAGEADEEDEDDDDDDDDDEDDEEPKLKYTRLTSTLGNVYRNGDATSAIDVTADKMVIGTHNGNIHVLSLPTLHPLRVYRAHSATITSVSISPATPNQATAIAPTSSAAALSPTLHVATSSLDGHTCITHLHDKKDVSLTNFSRPVSAIALSPLYKSDRMFLSGGLAGNLILSHAVANLSKSDAGHSGGSSWLPWGGGAKDTILHSGEGPVSSIKWSRVTPRFVVWANEKGIKLMRSHLTSFKGDRLEKAGEWKRISAIQRPDQVPEEMAISWKVRLEWVDLESLEKKADEAAAGGKASTTLKKHIVGSKPIRGGGKERLLVGWGGVIWVIDVYGGDGPSAAAPTKSKAPGDDGKEWGWAEIVHAIQTDCVVSGLTLFDPSTILLLGYLTAPPKTEEEETAGSGSDTPRRRIHHRSSALSPELRMIDLKSHTEVSADSLMMSRYESLSANDYHLLAMPPMLKPSIPSTSGGAIGLDALNPLNYGGQLWQAGLNATTLFSSAASIASSRPGSMKSEKASARSSFAGSNLADKASGMSGREEVNGWRLYLVSPYDCVFATERGNRDRLSWLLERNRFEEAWTLIDEHPDAVSSTTTTDQVSVAEDSEVAEDSVSENDTSTMTESTVSANQFYSAAEKEKRRVGELWLERLVREDNWPKAAEVAGKVLGTSARWEHWIWVFFNARKIREITPFIPTKAMRPPLPSTIYELVLAEYLAHDIMKLRELVEAWPAGLYDESAVIKAIEGKLKNSSIEASTSTSSSAKRPDLWRILHECLAILFLRAGRHEDALLERIQLKDADEAIRLAREYHLLHSIKGHIAEWLALRLDEDTLKTGPREEWEEKSQETIGLLVDEFYEHDGKGITIGDVVEELRQGDWELLLFFYLRSIWKHDLDVADLGAGRGKLAEWSDDMMALFAEYDRALFMGFLKISQSYSYEKAIDICQQRSYIPELVHMYSTIGQTKKALFLIINKLGDVSAAIAFAKSQDDPELWTHLLDHSMDKPDFIRGLLENVGTAIDPITLIRRIPEGLEIEGLKDGVLRILKEYEIQASISEGVAKVLRGEVATGMEKLRVGRRRGVKFDVEPNKIQESDVNNTKHDKKDHPEATAKGAEKPSAEGKKDTHSADSATRPGGCGLCRVLFKPKETQALVAFACGHVFHLRCLLRYGQGEGVDEMGIKQDDPEGHDRRSLLSPDNDDVEEEDDDFEGLLMGKKKANALRQAPDDGPEEKDDDFGYYSKRASVAEKVTRAVLIKGKIEGGCPLEKKEDDW